MSADEKRRHPRRCSRRRWSATAGWLSGCATSPRAAPACVPPAGRTDRCANAACGSLRPGNRDRHRRPLRARRQRPRLRILPGSEETVQTCCTNRASPATNPDQAHGPRRARHASTIMEHCAGANLARLRAGSRRTRCGAVGCAGPPVHPQPRHGTQHVAVPRADRAGDLASVFMTFPYSHQVSAPSAVAGRHRQLGHRLLQYCLQVPANRIGYRHNAAQLKTMQEIITLVVFVAFSVLWLGAGAANAWWLRPDGRRRLLHLLGQLNARCAQLPRRQRQARRGMPADGAGPMQTQARSNGLRAAGSWRVK